MTNYSPSPKKIQFGVSGKQTNFPNLLDLFPLAIWVRNGEKNGSTVARKNANCIPCVHYFKFEPRAVFSTTTNAVSPSSATVSYKGCIFFFLSTSYWEQTMLHLLKWMEPFHPAVLQGWNAVLLPKQKTKNMGIRCGCGEAHPQFFSYTCSLAFKWIFLHIR